MADSLQEMYQLHGLPVISAALKQVEGKSPGVLIDAEQYRRLIINPAWEELPAPLRMLGRKRLRWEELFFNLRTEVFDAGQGRVRLRPDAAPLILAQIAKTLQSNERPNVTPSTPPPPLPPVGSSAKAVALPVQKGRIPRDRPESSNATVGIDLGTTYSVVAHLDGQGRPCSIPNAAGDILTHV
jgi:hypothetical protein